MKLIAIDPANVESAYVIIETDTREIIDKGKIPNEELLVLIQEGMNKDIIEHLAIETIVSYGMAVGETTFETCIWIGRFIQLVDSCGLTWNKVSRRDEKLVLCGDSRAKDKNIRRALIDWYYREGYVKHDGERGTGTKNNQDYFYGFKADIWSAMAVAHVYMHNEC